MPPNIVDMPYEDNGVTTNSRESIQPLASSVTSDGTYALRTFQSAFLLLANILIGATVGAALMFSFSGGLPISSTPQHIVLCVLGYQLLMAQAILSLCPTNGWSLHLKFVDKRRAHWILQLAGSILAIVGSFIKIIDKSMHWHTLHGQFGLVALVFTVVSLVNGMTSLWAFEIRRILPPKLSKLTHICFGTIAFASASISLNYGFEKISFRGWATDPIAYTIISFTAIFTIIVIINPLIVFVTKFRNIR